MSHKAAGVAEMAEGGGEKAGGSTPDVFISYASLDGAIAETACEALEKAGVTCWIAPRDVTPGAFYGDEIVHAIDAAKAIVLILSQNATTSPHVLREVERAASKRHAVISLRVDKAPLPAGLEYFLNTSQWLDASSGDTVRALPKLVSAVQAAIQAPAVTPLGAPTAHSPLPAVSPRSPTKIGIIVASVIGLGLLAFAADRLRVSRQKAAAPPGTTLATPPSAVFSPPPHSIAVLPFVNMSGDKDQEYFSEGLTEELLNSLSRINQLQVAARTSSFSFQGEHPDIATVSHKLNVGAVLEGSVRRSAHTIRITTQLINGVTGFDLWSQTYDRDLGDVLALQTEIANAVASALKVTLLGEAAAKVELGGTRKPAAFDAYLKGSQAYRMYHEAKDLETAIAEYTNAIQLDPNYALAYVGRSRAFDELASWWVGGMADAIESYAKAQADAHKAIALAPDLGEGHLVLANSLAEQLYFTRASEEYERALALAPGNALVLQDYGLFAVLMGHSEKGLSAVRRAVLLDPLNRNTHVALADALYSARQPKEAISALHDALVLDPTYTPYQWGASYVLGNYQSARAMCESNPQYPDSHMCLALIYHKLGRHVDAEAEFAKFKAENRNGDDWPQYASVYAQWGDTTKALSSLEAALRIRHVALEYLKTEPMLDPLRQEPRFQAIERALKFPPQ
jgi:TolB-like protein/Tfp pilus assembly protein PilF